MLGVLLGQHLRQRAHHHPRIVQRLARHPLLAAQRARIVGEKERALSLFAHRRQHFLGNEEGPPAGDVLCDVEHLDRDVFEQLHIRRQVAAFEIARIVDQHVRIAGFAADRDEGRCDRILRHEIELDDHALAALLADRRRERRGIGLVAGRQHREKALLGEFLRDGAANAPSDADRHVAVVDRVAMRQHRVAAVRLPFRSGADHDADLLALAVGFHSRFSSYVASGGQCGPAGSSQPSPIGRPGHSRPVGFPLDETAFDRESLSSTAQGPHR